MDNNGAEQKTMNEEKKPTWIKPGKKPKKKTAYPSARPEKTIPVQPEQVGKQKDKPGTDSTLTENFALPIAEEEELREFEIVHAYGTNTAEAPFSSRRDTNSRILKRGAIIESIRNAIYNKSILENTISGIEKLTIGHREGIYATFRIAWGIKAIIPYDSLFETDPLEELEVSDSEWAEMSAKRKQLRSNYNEVDGKNAPIITRQKKAADKMLNVKTKWLPLDVEYDPETDLWTVVGSRTEALEIIRNAFWLSDPPRIRQGHSYRGIVTAVYDHGILVNLYGYEQYLKQFKATNRYAENMRDLFNAGDEILVSVKDMEVDRENEIVEATFDCITGELYKYKPEPGMINVGSSGIAVISKIIMHMVDGEQRFAIIAWLESLNVALRVVNGPVDRFGMDYSVGDRVIVNLREMSDDGYVKCYISDYCDKSGLR